MPAIRNLIVLFGALLLAACTIQLVPAYDQALVEGLDKSNTETLTLFAAVDDGSAASEFPKYEERYADVIGNFDALRQRAMARQVPPLASRLSKIKSIGSFCNSEGDPTGCVNASPGSLEQVLSLLRRMRILHKTRGLEKDEVATFRDSYAPAIAQALTVENALKR